MLWVVVLLWLVIYLVLDFGLIRKLLVIFDNKFVEILSFLVIICVGR